MRFEFPSQRLTFNRFLLAGTTPFSACVAATVQSGFALTEALRRLEVTLMANSRERVAATATSDLNSLHAISTRSSVTDLFAWMATREELATRFPAIGYRIFTRCPGGVSGYAAQWCLPTRAIQDHIGGLGTMSAVHILRVAALLAEVQSTIKWATTQVTTAERTGPLMNLPTNILLALQLFFPGTAQHRHLHLPTVALGLDTYLTGTAETFVTRLLTGMFAAR